MKFKKGIDMNRCSFQINSKFFWISIQLLTAVLPGLTSMSCAIPPSSTYSPKSGTPLGGSTATDATGGGAYSNSGSSVGSSDPATSASPSPTPSSSPSPQAPTCTMSTPTLNNYNNMYYYVQATLTLTNSVPISNVTFYLSDSTGYPTVVGYASASPYQVQYMASQSGYGATTLTALLVDKQGQSYPTACSTSYSIHY